MLSLENIKEGLHILSIRFQDNKGKWSVPVNHHFYKPTNILQEYKIIAYRYWLNDNIENARYYSFPDPGQEINLNEDLDFSDLISGEYIIHLQFKDTSDKWSLVTSDSFNHTSTIGIENRVEKAITVYPNPTKGWIRISSDNEFPLECTIEVHDCFGKVVLIEHLASGKNHEINLSELSKGVYYLNIITNNRYSYQKVVLQ
jgi:hypothetical protein